MKASHLRSGKSHRDENFPVASLLIAKAHREPILAFYNFVRTADDIADHPSLAPELKLFLLDQLEAGLNGASDSDPEALTLKRVLSARRLSDRHARDLLQAFRLDVTKNRYESWRDLIDYCALSAMPVGRFVLEVHGESKSTWPASDPVCAALQIINHIQDCGEDFRKIDRVYLPAQTLSEHHANVPDLAKPQLSPELRCALDALLDRTSDLLEEGAQLPGMVRDQRLTLEIELIIRLARRNIQLLRREDCLAGGGRTSKLMAALLMAGSLTTAMARKLSLRPRLIVAGKDRS